MARSTTVTDASGSKVPQRSGVATSIPAKSGKTRDGYVEWSGEIEDLKVHLGEAWNYDDVPNVGTLCQGLRRTYGIVASARNMNRDKDDKNYGHGTLWIEYPSVDNGDGTRTANEAKVVEIKAKYAKTS